MAHEVKSFMTGKPISIDAESPAIAALDLMVEFGIRHLPVIDEERRVRGVVSIDDLRAALPFSVRLTTPPGIEARQDASDLLVGEVMTFAPTTLRYDASLEKAVACMIDGRFGCLPIVDEEGHLEGILTETDLLHALATSLWSTRERETPARQEELVPALERERDQIIEEIEEIEELAGFASKRLKSIESALARAERGELGVCESCGGRIQESRLRVLPGTTVCARCS